MGFHLYRINFGLMVSSRPKRKMDHFLNVIPRQSKEKVRVVTRLTTKSKPYHKMMIFLKSICKLLHIESQADPSTHRKNLRLQFGEY